MAQDAQPGRPWREIATEASTERDADKVVELVGELIHALDQAAQQRAEKLGKSDKHNCSRTSAGNAITGSNATGTANDAS